MLPDGTYDVIVVDSESVAEGRIRVELTIVGGDHKGDVVTVQAPAREDPESLLGIPGTLTVTDGSPHLDLEP